MTALQHEDVVQPQLLPPPFAGQPTVVLKHAHFSWGDGEGERSCTLRDISLKVVSRACSQDRCQSYVAISIVLLLCPVVNPLLGMPFESILECGCLTVVLRRKRADA